MGMGMAGVRVLGMDGSGYETARKLERKGVWRVWLGDSLYNNSPFRHSLSSPSHWHSFFFANSNSNSNSDSDSDIQLQLRVRALLFDKAALSLFDKATLNPNDDYLDLELHADDVYFTLDHHHPPPPHPHPHSKVSSQRFTQEDFPQTWYHHFINNYKLSSPLPDSHKRTPSGMSHYLKLSDTHKRRRFGASHHNDLFFPETMFIMNSVPDTLVAPPPTSSSSTHGNHKLDFNGVLDTLPKMVTKSSSSIMLQRLGIRPEYLTMEQPSAQSHTRVATHANKTQLGADQATLMSNKVVSRMLTNTGFQGATEIPLEILSQFLSCHISKLGRVLKLLTDSYRKQCSATELIKMFLQAGGHSLSSLAEHVKDTRPVLPPTPQQIQSPQSQLVPSQQNMLQLPQQVPRQMHQQLPQMLRPHNLTPQQLDILRRRQAASPRAIMGMDKDRPMIEVKLENPPDLPMDRNNNSRQTQAQLHWQEQQKIAALQQFGHQMRQPTSMQIPQMLSPNTGAVRAQPVKVEGFQELMGGDTSSKQNADENKLTSPSK